MEPVEQQKETLVTDHRKSNCDLDKSTERGQWANKTEFILAIVGEIIGLGNVWRFPYLCFRNGGGKRWIPTWTGCSESLCLCWKCAISWFPVFRSILIAVRSGPVHLWNPSLFPGGVSGSDDWSRWNHLLEENMSSVWRSFPFALSIEHSFWCLTAECFSVTSGLGYGSQVLVLFTIMYYIIILAWAFLYLFNSFQTTLPWASCNNTWNTGNKAKCIVRALTRYCCTIVLQIWFYDMMLLCY